MTQRADFVAYNQDGQILLIAEVKNRVSTSKTWAARLRRNLLAHGFLPKVPLFLLALPDKFYIWKNADNIPVETEPNYEINAIPLLQSYYERGDTKPETITKQGLELALTAWFNELAQLGVPMQIPAEERNKLVDSGIVDALKQGHMSYQVGL